MVGPTRLELVTSAMSRRRSKPTELRAPPKEFLTGTHLQAVAPKSSVEAGDGAGDIAEAIDENIAAERLDRGCRSRMSRG